MQREIYSVENIENTYLPMRLRTPIVHSTRVNVHLALAGAHKLVQRLLVRLYSIPHALVNDVEVPVRNQNLQNHVFTL